MYCLPTDTLNRLKLLERTYIIFEGNKYPLSFQHKNMTDITHSFTKTCFFHYIQLNNYSFACNNSRKKRGKGRHYSKIGAYQKRRTGGRKGETDTSSQTVTHLFVFFCYVAEYLNTQQPILCLNHKRNGNKIFYSLYLQALFQNKTKVINTHQHLLRSCTKENFDEILLDYFTCAQ